MRYANDNVGEKKNRRKRKSVCDIAKGKEKTSKKCGENKR